MTPMLAQLGTVVFEVVGPLTGVDVSAGYGFAEHGRIGLKPALQFTGEDLDDLSLELLFSTAFCDPASSVRDLRALAAAHEAVPFFWASGEVQGYYVLRTVSTTVLETDALGSMLRASCRVRLTEWVDPDPEASAQPGSAAGTPAGGTTAPGGAVTGPEQQQVQAGAHRQVPVSRITREAP